MSFRYVRHGLLRGTAIPSWVLAGATVDLWFAKGLYYGANVSQIVNTRASSTMAVDSQNVWHSFPALMSAITDLGVWIWEARTNSIRVSNPSAATPGTPGVAPANWAIINNGGLSSQIVGVGVESGLPYVDWRFFGTTTSTILRLAFEGLTQIAAASGQVWSESSFAYRVGGSSTGITTISNTISTRNSSGVALTNFGQSLALPVSGPLGGTRSQNNILIADATATCITPSFDIGLVNATAVDFTIRFGPPQMELVPSATTAAQGFSTSPILTTAGALTRAADSISMPVSGGNNCVYAIGTPSAPVSSVTNQGFAALSDGTASNTLRLYRATVGPGVASLIIGTVGVGPGAFASLPSGVLGKFVGFATPTLFSVRENGGTIGTAIVANVTLPSSKLSIGQLESSAFKFNGVISRIALSPVSLLSQ